jgi:ubiquitin-like protein Pup
VAPMIRIRLSLAGTCIEYLILGGNNMAEREQKKKTTQKSKEEVVEDLPTSNESGEALKAELDDLLDEIDDVLETNAEDFVKSYVQKGGQ